MLSTVDERVGSRVLLVDDDRAVTDALQRALFAAPFTVLAANSGREALDLCSRLPIDVIVTDECMPGMAGSELLLHVRALHPGVVRLVLTGHASVDATIRAINEAGVFRYLRKPCPPGDLSAAIVDAIADGRRVGNATGDPAAAAVLEEALRGASMAYQPIVSLRARRTVALEALLRPSHPALPHVGALLESARRLSRTREVDMEVLALVARDLPRLPESVTITVNVHPETLLDPRLLAACSPLSRELRRVVFEVTERATLPHGAELTAALAALRARGARFAVDDIGSGYSGLSSIAELQPELVKMDMGLVRGIETSPTQLALAEALVSLCAKLRIHLIAEGIETPAERDCLSNLGLDLLQGYYFARPSANPGPVTW